MDSESVKAALLFSALAKKQAIAAANEHSDTALAAAIAALPKALVYKGAVNYVADLPTQGNKIGDCYTVLYKGSTGTETDGTEYAWANKESVEQWVPIGPDVTGKADKALIAQEYAPTAAYAVGAYCIYGDKLYRCTTAIPAPGEAWTPAHWVQTTVTEELTPGGGDKPYLALLRRDTYLFDVSYGAFPPDNGTNLTPGGACSSFVRGGKLYRNMDWGYDELATFHLKCPGFEGCAFLSGLTASVLDDALIGQLPYHICDGKNDHGIMMATHVLYNDWDAHGTGEIPLTKLPYLVLSRVKSMATLGADLAGVLENLYVPAAMVAQEYLLQVIVTDGVTTCVIRPGNSEAATYEIVDATANPKLTNFRWVSSATVNRASLQRRPTGVERWNMINDSVALSDLRFTKAYEEATRLSEFIGINGTTKDSTDAELTAIYDLARAAYLMRTRDGTTWQTMHSAVYGPAGLEHLWIQEDWTRDFADVNANAEMVGASSSADGKAGKVPAPASGDRDKFLRGDGSWATPQSGGGDTAGVVAPAYSQSETYDEGDLVIYESLLYRAKQDISTPEVWTEAHWEQTTVDAELKQYMKYSTLVVTCLTQDGVTVTGQTVTVRKGSDASGPVYAQATYNGQPVSILVPVGLDYFVSVSDTLDHHFNPTTAAGVVNAGTINITLTYSDFSNIRSFSDVKAALNADIDLTGLVGEDVSATRQGRALPFEVTDYDAAEGSVWILLHDTLPTQMAFEPSQALAWFENGLAAGAYCFTHSNKIYYFTLTKPIPEDGQLRATTSTFSTYVNQDASTALESGSVSETEIAGATSLGTTATGDLNHMDRVNYGSNNAGESGLFAWLNSDAEPNTNLPRINKFSRPYSSGSDGGFLYGFDPADLACLEDVTWTIQANNVYEAPASMGGITAKGQQYNITGKIGLAKLVNVGLSGSNPWDLYVGATNTDRIKYYNGSARGWWVFDANSLGANLEYYVSSSGGSSNDLALNSYGVVPACKIKKSM